MRTSRRSPRSSTRRPRTTRLGRRDALVDRDVSGHVPVHRSRPTGVRSAPPRSAGSTSTRRTSTRSGRRSTSSPMPAARGRYGAAGGRLERAAGRRQGRPPHARSSDGRPDGVDFLAPPGFREYERSKIRPPRARRARAAGRRRCPAGVVADDARRRPGPDRRASTPSRSRPSPTSRAARRRWRPATWRSSARATSTGRSIPPAAFFIAAEDATGRVVGYASLLLQPGATGAARVARHDRRRARLARPGPGRRPQARDDRLGDRRRHRRPRGRQRHRQPGDARGQCPARLRAAPGQPHPAWRLVGGIIDR